MAPGHRLPRSPLGPPPDAAPVLAAAWAAIGFLIETGALLHFPDTSHGLRNLYFLDPIWLSECLQRIFSIRGSRSVAKNGVIRAEDLRVLLVGTGFTQQTEEQYFQFLAKFEIALPVANNRCVTDRAAPGSTEPGPEGGGRACRGHGPASERGEGGRARRTPGSQPEPAQSLGPPCPDFHFGHFPGLMPTLARSQDPTFIDLFHALTIACATHLRPDPGLWGHPRWSLLGGVVWPPCRQPGATFPLSPYSDSRSALYPWG